MKIFYKCIFLACFFLGNFAVNATCTLDIGGDLGGSPPITFELPAQVLNISADQPVSKDNPFFRVLTHPAGVEVMYIHCPTTVRYGGMPLNLPVPDGNNIYSTNIDGVGMKILWHNGANAKDIPYERTFHGLVRMIYPSSSYYILEFYKTEENIKLSAENVNVVINGGELSYVYIGLKSLSNYAQKLNSGRITINSTPACTFENTKVVNFDTVTPTMADAGVERPLDFEISCKTDYGSYSVTASMIADSRSQDGDSIMVTDASGNKDRLKIKISDSDGSLIHVDGMTLKKVKSNSAIPAKFNWKATLFSASPAGKRATAGQFNAKAEILLQVN